MARNILKAGHTLVVCDINTTATSDLYYASQDAVKIVSTPKEVAGIASTVFTSLNSNDSVRKVYLDPIQGLVTSSGPSHLLIDASTISPSLVREITQACHQRQTTFMDAPVSGGVTAAQGGTLSFMVGAEPAALERVRPLLLTMGTNIIPCGEPGQGQVAKICNNLLLAIQMLGLCEALTLGQKLGMDPTLLTEIINVSSGYCWSSQRYNPAPGVHSAVPASKEYRGGFNVKLMKKDLGLAMEMAHQANTVIPMGSLANQLYLWMSQHPDFKDLDFSSYFKYLGRGG